MDAGSSSLSALAELLKPDNAESEDDNLPSRGSQYSATQTPGHIGPLKSESLTNPSKSVNGPCKNIWDAAEVQESSQLDNALDTRVAPKYEILFKQKVTSEDMFLGMFGRNPSTACCEELTVKIWLPDTEFSSVHLNVTDTFLDCQTPKYKLGLYFPHSVDSKKGKAQWEADKSLLTVTSPIVREYDFLNKYSTQ